MIFNSLKAITFAVGLAGLLASPGAVQAQDPSVQATILYLYRMDSWATLPGRPDSTRRAAIQAVTEQNPKSQVQFFQDLREDNKFIALIVGPDAQAKTSAGWSRNCFMETNSAVPARRCFVLNSTLLVGDPRLEFSGTSWIQIEHVDSDPMKRDANLPLFQRLQTLMQRQPGFQGLQVWTWTARPNHWTVITQWIDAEASRRAAADPEVMATADQIYANEAAPSNADVVRAIRSF